MMLGKQYRSCSLLIILQNTLLVLSLIFSVVSCASQDGEQDFDIDPDTPPAEWVLKESPVLSAEESIERFDLPPGFRAEIVADDSLLYDPINITFGPDGRIWVVEYPSYNRQLREEFGLEDIEHPGDRLVFLEDTNGDGKMDKRTVFKDDLKGPRTISIIDDGVLVSNPPEIWYYRDTTGDGKADSEELIRDDYGDRPNPHVVPGGLMWAMDNWIYSTIYEKRLRWNHGEWKEDGPLVNKGQWGITQDNWGRIYFNRQADPLRGNLVPAGYWSRNPNFPEPAGINIRLAHNMDTFPHAPTPGVQPVHLDENAMLFRFTSASAPVIYRGENFPQDMIGDAFVAVPTANFVRQFRLTEEGGVIDAVNRYENHEFLFSHDERFRPSDLKIGPDGALYVVDKYRGIIEGYPWLEQPGKDYIMARNLHEPFTGLGRIYRIVHEDGPLGDWPAMHEDSDEKLVQHLKRPNGWWRDNAQQLLIERRAKEMANDLSTLLEDTTLEPYVRLHAVWTLEGLEELGPTHVKQALNDPHFRVREHGLRLAERWLDDEEIFSAVSELTEDERVEVRRQLLFTLGEVGERFSDRAEVLMRQILEQDADAEYMVEAALSGLYGKEYKFLNETLQKWSTSPVGGEKLVRLFSTAITNEGDSYNLAQLALLAGEGNWWGMSVLEGMSEGNSENIANSQDAVDHLENLNDEELQQKADVIIAAITGAGENIADTVEVSEMDEVIQDLYERGQSAFITCAACHQAEGQGLTDVAPPLNNSIIINDKEKLLRIVLHGYDANDNFPVMGSFSGLTNDDLAATLTYISLTWSNEKKVIYPEDVQRVRENEHRHSPWTYQELEQIE